jgi:hypothetical protein
LVWRGIEGGYTLEANPGFRKRVPFSSSVGERKIMNHFVVICAGFFAVECFDYDL